MDFEIKIGNQTIGSAHPPMIVAEMSGNHCGSLENALKIVEKAKEAGVHAIKLQTYRPDTITLNSDEKEFYIHEKGSLWDGRRLYDLYQEAHTPWEWHQPIFSLCRKLDIEIFSSPFDETAIDFLETLSPPCYKIASLEIVDHALIQKAARTGKPLIISTGTATLVEIGEAVTAARNAGCKRLILLKCTAAYPAHPIDMHLRTIPHLRDCFETLVGLSDHTLGLGVAIAGVAMGACLIEKHFILDRSKGGVDSGFSLEPSEFRMLVDESKKAWQALGKISYGNLNSEKSIFSLRPSLYFSLDLPAGIIVKQEHICSVRPGCGLPPKELSRIVGLTLNVSVKKGTPVSWELFKCE